MAGVIWSTHERALPSSEKGVQGPETTPPAHIAYAGRDPELADGDMFTACVWTTFAGVQSAKGQPFLDAELLEIVSRYQPVRSADIVAAASASERTVKHHLAHLVSDGSLLAEGTTRDRRYRLP